MGSVSRRRGMMLAQITIIHCKISVSLENKLAGVLCRSKPFSFAQHLLSLSQSTTAYSGLVQGGEQEEVEGLVI